MKTSMYIIFLLFIQVAVFSQHKQTVGLPENKIIDSLKIKLTQAKDDTSRLNILGSLGLFYEGVNLDSSLKYGQIALAIAKEGHYINREANALAGLSGIMRVQGKFAEALDFLFKALKIAEENNNRPEIARCNRRLGLVYFELENFPKALEYFLQALKGDEEIQRTSRIVLDQINLGDVYEKMNKPDSALLYAEKAYKQSKPTDYFRPSVEYTLGKIWFKKENDQLSYAFYKTAYDACIKINDFGNASNDCAGIAEIFIKQHKKDSAIYYALKAFEYGQKASYKKGVLLSGNMLGQLYDSIQPAVALTYYKIANAAKDSLFGIGNMETIQHLVAREESRQKELEAARLSYRNRLKWYGLLTGFGMLFIIAVLLYRNNRKEQKANVLLQQQKEKIETTLTELKSTQAQLIQSEKMASLGELTAGIAHEIQNPLNFVNNFSDVNREMITDLKQEMAAGNITEANEIANEIEQNEAKINHHGKRAEAIVKSMLQHSRRSAGVHEFTEINRLTEEYLRLAFQGYRAKDNLFNATVNTNFDEHAGKINIIPQDIGSVLLNLYNNAFYAVQEKKKSAAAGYEPIVSVSTEQAGNQVTIIVRDNGNGIPQKAVDKIFQPFFTTKPTGQGTGLGLSLSYDIIKAHGGEIKVETKEGEGSVFRIQFKLPAT